MRLVISVLIPLIVFCAVFTIQVVNGFQRVESTGILLALIIISIILYYLVIKYSKEVNIRKKNIILTTIAMVTIWILLISVILSVSFSPEVKFNYPQNGDPVPQNLSMSGTYRNVDDNTNLWLYTFSDKRWFLEYAEKMPYEAGSHDGYWFINKTQIGSDNVTERGYFFTIGFILVPNELNESFKNFSIKFRETGNESLPKGNYKKLDNITVFRMFPQI